MELFIEGGFAGIPGFARPFVVDNTQLSAGEAEEFCRLREAATAAGWAEGTSRRPANPDGRRYRLMIEIGGVRRRVAVADRISRRNAGQIDRFFTGTSGQTMSGCVRFGCPGCR